MALGGSWSPSAPVLGARLGACGTRLLAWTGGCRRRDGSLQRLHSFRTGYEKRSHWSMGAVAGAEAVVARRPEAGPPGIGPPALGRQALGRQALGGQALGGRDRARRPGPPGRGPPSPGPPSPDGAQGCRVQGCRVMGCRVMGCRVMGCRVMGCRVMGWASFLGRRRRRRSWTSRQRLPCWLRPRRAATR